MGMLCPPPASVPPNVVAGMITPALPPGLSCVAALVILAVGGFSIPKFIFTILVLLTVKVALVLLILPSDPEPVPFNSAVLTQPVGSRLEGEALPIIAGVVLKTT
jgi:hypothetical protein